MKRMFVAGALALALTAAGRQEASAWCRFNFGVGLNISYESSGHTFSSCWNCTSNPAPPCWSPYCASPFAGYPAYPGYAYGSYGAAAPYAQTAPAATAPAYRPAAAAPAQTQQVGYYFYGQGYAPSYWYGY